MRRLLLGLLALLAFATPALAASDKPLVIIAGRTQVIPSGDTLNLTLNPLTTNITGVIQCVQASSAGILSGTGSACGTGSGAGTVTNVSSSSADLTVASPTTTPVLTVVSAPKLTTARALTYTGDATGGPTSFDGSVNVSTALTLANTAVTPGTYGDATHTLTATVDAKGRLTALSTNAISAGSGTVTHTAGALTSGQLVFGNGAADITVGDLSGDVSTSGSGATTIGALKVATGMIQASAVTLAKIANASANTRFVGSGSSGSGAAYAEQTISAGTGISITPGASGITITNVGAGSVGAEVLISSVVTSGSQSNVTFSSIPATFTDLRIVVRGRNTTAGIDAQLIIQLNGDTGNNYLYNLGNTNPSASPQWNINSSSAGASSFPAGYIPAATATANWAGYSEITVGLYSGTTFTKPLLSRTTDIISASTGSLTGWQAVGLWNSTSAVNAVKVFFGSGAFVDGSTVSLYGRY